MNLKKVSLAILLVSTIIQIVVIICNWNVEQVSDYAVYERLANECYSNSTFYPMAKHVYSDYLFAPGFVNLLVLELYVFGTLKLHFVLNFLMGLGIVFFIYQITNTIFSQRAAFCSIILYSILYNNWVVSLNMCTDIPFIFLVTMALYLILSKRGLWMVVAGLTMAIANWNRPLVMILIPSIIWLLVALGRKRALIPVFSTYLIALACIGFVNKSKVGIFSPQSSTTGVNMIMVANDKATGGYIDEIFSDNESPAYIENKESYTYAERDSIWKSRAIYWIKDHPFKYAVHVAKAPIRLFSLDTWGDLVLRKDLNAKKELKDYIMLFVKNITYYLVLVLFFLSFYYNRKDLLTIKGSIYMLFIVGVGVTCLFPAAIRYHAAFFFAAIIGAASGLDLLINNKKFSKG